MAFWILLSLSGSLCTKLGKTILLIATITLKKLFLSVIVNKQASC